MDNLLGGARILPQAAKREFGERGFIVVPDVLSPEAVAAGMAYVDALIRQKPPPAGHRGHHFYWPGLTAEHPLSRLLVDSGALAVAEELIHPGKLELPRQAQISLNIPPYDHRPGRGHIDGVTPPEPDGRPGTFTPHVRRVVYYLQREGHRDRWRECIQDALLEFDAVRDAIAARREEQHEA